MQMNLIIVSYEYNKCKKTIFFILKITNKLKRVARQPRNHSSKAFYCAMNC